jgi:acyl-CoA synthetase (AMP-forming)/AMP-acid ligase II
MLDFLLDRFATAPEKPAMIWHDRVHTYGWLLERIREWGRELDARGVAPGTVFAVKGDYTPEVCALLLALIDRGAIIVPLSSAAEANAEQFLGIAESQAGIAFKPDGWEFFRREGAVTHPLTLSLVKAGQPGLVLFSSGSTGKPKAILHNFAMLLEKFKTPRHSLRTITFLLLDHIGGINTLLYVLSNLGTIVTVGRRDPDTVCAAIARHGVELLPTTPTFLNLLLLSEAHLRHDLTSLKQITYGTEMMPETTLRRVAELFPGVKILQTYGMSELGILRSKSRSSDSLWVKIGGDGFETRVVDGILHVRAQSAMVGYLNAPHPFDAEGWLNTGDEVEVDGEYVRFRGRRSEIINVGGEKVFPAEIENVLMQMDNVHEVTVAGEPNRLTGNIAVARVRLRQPEPLAAFKTRMREHCRGRLEPYKIPAKVEVVTTEQYSERYKKIRQATPGAPAATPSGEGA